MKNVEVKIEGTIMTITVDISQDHGPSASGKTQIIGTSGGNQMVAPNVYVGLNVYKK